MGFLDDIVERTRADLDIRRREQPLERLIASLSPPGRSRPFSEALVAPGISLIAEMKRASPSRGPIHPDAKVEDVVQAYEAAGAAACSILTEPHSFGGRREDLSAAREACSLPLLRKDFIVDEYQLAEARALGADAALLIVAALSRARLEELIGFGSSLGLDLLVEVHDADEVDVAVEAGAEIVGVNNRNLSTLKVDTGTVLRILPDVPAGTVVVAESGITSNDDVAAFEHAGVDAILVGEALMSSDDPSAAVRDLLGR